MASIFNQRSLPVNPKMLACVYVCKCQSVINAGRYSVLTEKKLESKCSRVMNMSTSSTRPPSCIYCFGELSPMEGTPANMLFPSERDSASSRSRPPPRARFLGEERGWLFTSIIFLSSTYRLQNFLNVFFQHYTLPRLHHKTNWNIESYLTDFSSDDSPNLSMFK